MKTIRYFAALLMLISGAWHIALYVKAPDENGIIVLSAGILYAIIGLLLFTPKKLGVYLGLIPIIAPILAPFMLDFKNLDVTTTLLLIIDVVVFICCIYILLKRNKVKT